MEGYESKGIQLFFRLKYTIICTAGGKLWLSKDHVFEDKKEDWGDKQLYGESDLEETI